MMISNKTISALKERRLEFDCTEMILTQNKDANPITYVGKGFIRQNSDDELTFKLYAFRSENITFHDQVNVLGSAESGKLWDATDFYTLKATAANGTVWISDSVLPAIDISYTDPNPIIRGQLSSVYTISQKVKSAHSLYLHFFGEADIPDSQFVAAGVRFDIRKPDNEQFTLSALSDDALSEDFDMRTEEAMKFVLGQSVSWRVLIRNDGKTCRAEYASGSSNAVKPKLLPPISAHYPGHLESVWVIFAKYIEYILARSQKGFWNDISYHIDNARQSSAGSYDSWAIGIGVAVEGISSFIPLEKTNEEKEELRRLKMFVLQNVLSHDNYRMFDQRLDGLLTTMQQVRIQDRLQMLAREGYVDPRHVRSWSKMRNTHVHPKKRDLENMKSADYQALIDRVHGSTVLMYQIVFYLIGYVGKFTDYSRRNFPTGVYPVPTSTPAAMSAVGK